MHDISLANKKILVLGCGESGLAMANWCFRQQAQVFIADSRTNTDYKKFLAQEITYFRGINLELLLQVNPDIILLSPGLSPYQNPIKDIYSFAKNNKIAIHGELWLFQHALNQLKEKDLYIPKIIAITGTNGKTTTTQLTNHLCCYAGKSSIVAGNISPSLLTALIQNLENNSLPQIWILELSSFQLHEIQNFNPDIATILNISIDHLDWHTDFNNYIKAKFNIFGQNTKILLNRDDEELKKYIFSLQAQSFGIDKSDYNYDFSLIKHNDGYWIYHHQQALLPINALKIRGLHNAQNAMAALALCSGVGIDIQEILGGLCTYNGEPHRVELIDIINDIEIYDDSKGTNVGATIAAINGLQKSIILIAGGDGKGQDFTPLIPSFKQYVTSVHLIGKDKEKLAQICIAANIPYYLYNTLEHATIEACSMAKSTQGILLSPACASLDMFNNYVHRAEIFIQSVKKWQQKYI